MSEFLGLPPEAICPVCGAEVRHHDHEMLYHHAVEIYAKLYARQKVRIAELEGKLRQSEAREVDRTAHLDEILELARIGASGGDSARDSCQDVATLAESALTLSPLPPGTRALLRLQEAASRLCSFLRKCQELPTALALPGQDDRLAGYLRVLMETDRAYLAARSGRGEEG